MKGKLSGIVTGLIAWAVLITIGIAIMVGLVFKRMRSQQARAVDRKSVFSDTESGRADSTTHESPSIIMVDDHQTGQIDEVVTSPTHVDMDTVGELFEDDSNAGSSEEALPQFGRALTHNSINGRLQGRFVPDKF